jgi:hypothetical protein
MFEQILLLVKKLVGENKLFLSSFYPENTPSVHNEIATVIYNALRHQAIIEGGIENVIDSIKKNSSEGKTFINSIHSTLGANLNTKFGIAPIAVKTLFGTVTEIINQISLIHK